MANGVLVPGAPGTAAAIDPVRLLSDGKLVQLFRLGMLDSRPEAMLVRLLADVSTLLLRDRLPWEEMRPDLEGLGGLGGFTLSGKP